MRAGVFEFAQPSLIRCEEYQRVAAKSLTAAALFKKFHGREHRRTVFHAGHMRFVRRQDNQTAIRLVGYIARALGGGVHLGEAAAMALLLAQTLDDLGEQVVVFLLRCSVACHVADVGLC